MILVTIMCLTYDSHACANHIYGCCKQFYVCENHVNDGHYHMRTTYT